MTNHPSQDPQKFSRTQYEDRPVRGGHEQGHSNWQRRGWQPEGMQSRNYADTYGGNAVSNSPNNYHPDTGNYRQDNGNHHPDDYVDDEYSSESFYARQERGMATPRGHRGQYREPWPRNEDRENYAAVADYRYGARPKRYFDDETRTANRGARPYNHDYADQSAGAARRSAPMSSYFNPSDFSSRDIGSDPRNAGNYSDSYSGNYSGNYDHSHADAGHSQNYGNVQRWQERSDAQIGAFGMQSQRGKGPRGYVRSDERIREDVCEQLSEHHYIDASGISVAVKDGVVTLEGAVDDRWQKYQVEDLTAATSGVKDINNRLTVQRADQIEQAETSAQDKTVPTTVRS